jgi:hypothetical protein
MGGDRRGPHIGEAQDPLTLTLSHQGRGILGGRESCGENTEGRRPRSERLPSPPAYLVQAFPLTCPRSSAHTGS